MLAYIQVSKSTKKIDGKFHQLFRNCHYKDATSELYINIKSTMKPGYIVGAILLIGHIPSEEYTTMSDETTEQYIKFYQKGQNNNILCYPILATIHFRRPIFGIPKGNTSALKLNSELLNTLETAVGKQTLDFCKKKLKTFAMTKSVSMESRVLILRKPHIINTFLGYKAAEYRSTALSNVFLPRIKNSTDLKKILRYRLDTRKKQTEKLKCYLSKFNC